jgi:hypothetical protein
MGSFPSMQGAAIVDQYVTEYAIRELMYFGHTRA